MAEQPTRLKRCQLVAMKMNIGIGRVGRKEWCLGEAMCLRRNPCGVPKRCLFMLSKPKILQPTSENQWCEN